MLPLSIITVNLNNVDGLRKTFESVFGQSFSDFEYLVIDGGSTDGSYELIKNNNNLLNYWISETDSGIYQAMNKGIRKAKGEYCLFLNSGDQLINSNILSEVFNFKYHADILYGNMQVVKNGQVIGLATTPAIITFKTLFEGTIHHQAAFIKRILFESYGLYDEEYRIRSDWGFWIKTVVLNNCTTHFINKVISVYDAGGLSSFREAIEIEKNETDIILSKSIPMKVLADYKMFINSEKEVQILKWASKKKMLNFVINLSYNLATGLKKIIKRDGIN
jgi:glycosyltransferase involved in cell wall biosynthesis